MTMMLTVILRVCIQAMNTLSLYTAALNDTGGPG
jgi:hypothetical protein